MNNNNPTTTKNTPAVVLLSGGLDSVVLLHYVAKELQHYPIYTLTFQYGQKHDVELTMAKWQCDNLPQVTEHKVIELDFFAKLIDGSSTLVKGGDDVPSLTELSDEQRKQPSTYVPNRNMMLLSIAAAYAEAKNAGKLYYGAQAQDEYGYWDCTNDFIANINNVLNLNRLTPVQIIAPFANWRKSQEVILGTKLGVDFAHTWSCYKGEEKPCCECPTCVERLTAFAEANLQDPLI